jgi:hypothetical protein
LGSFAVLKETKNGKTKKDSKNKSGDEDVLKVAILERSLMEICGKNSFFILRLSSNAPMCKELYTAALKTIKQKYSGKKDVKENEKSNENKSGTEKNEKDGTDSGSSDDEKTEEDQNEVPSFPEDRLETEDAVMLAKRFELAGVVHIEGFVSFFDESFLRSHSIAARGLPVSYESAITGISPFRWSTEWTDLKQTSILRQSTQILPLPPAPKAVEPPIPGHKSTEPEIEHLKPPAPEKTKEIPKLAPVQITAEPKSPPAAEKKTEEKKPEDKTLANDAKPSAPVVSQGCGCFGSKPPAIDNAEEKKKPTDPPTPMPRQEKKNVDDKPLAKEEKDTVSVDEGKSPETPRHKEEKKVSDTPLPVLKHSEEFETPPKPRSSGNRNVGFLPDRDGLGKEDDKRIARLNADLGGVPTPISAQETTPASGGPRRRLRRHEDRDFAHEKNSNPLDGESDEEIDGGAVRFNAPRSRGGR